MTQKAKKHALDIFETLAAIDRHDVDFLSRLTEDQAKGFAPPVVLRWASAVAGQHRDWYLLAVNERANVHFYDIWQHPELQYKLIATCGLGVKEKHDWIGGKKSGAQKRREFVERYWPDANSIEADIILQHLSEPNILDDTLMGMGMQADEIKAIKTIFKG